MRHAMTYRNSDIPADSTKGLFFGDVCNRTACDNAPAHWFNTGTYAYYCKECADAIDWRRDRGVPRLCVEVGHDLSVEEMDQYVKINFARRVDADDALDNSVKRGVGIGRLAMMNLAALAAAGETTIRVRRDHDEAEAMRGADAVAEMKDKTRKQQAYMESLKRDAEKAKPYIDAAEAKRQRKNAKRLGL